MLWRWAKKNMSFGQSRLMVILPYMLMAALKGNFYYINKEMSVYRMGAIGSTVRKDMNLERRKQRDICFIETVENFDELTNHRFHEDVVEAVRRYRFEIADVEKNYNVLLAPEMKKIGRNYLCM